MTTNVEGKENRGDTMNFTVIMIWINGKEYVTYRI